MTSNLPPLFIDSGKFYHQGWGDLQADYLIRHLPQFTHALRSGPTVRILHDMHTEDGVCAVGTLRTPEREDYVLFSDRPLAWGGFQLVIRHSRRSLLDAALDDQGEVDLAKLAAIPQLAGGYAGGRAYDAAILKFIGGSDHTGRIERLVDDIQMFGLLHGGRLDYGFTLAASAQWYQKQVSVSLDLDYLQIRGVKPFETTYVACSKGPVSRSVIDAVNALLQRDDNWAEFVEPLRPWSTADEFARALASRRQ